MVGIVVSPLKLLMSLGRMNIINTNGISTSTTGSTSISSSNNTTTEAETEFIIKGLSVTYKSSSSSSSSTTKDVQTTTSTSTTSTTTTATLPEYTYKDVREHRTSKDGWIAVHGKVYDITSFISKHPGGDVIKTSLGRDATILYETHHNLLTNTNRKNVDTLLNKYCIGTIKNYQPICTFQTEFSTVLLQRVKDHIHTTVNKDGTTKYNNTSHRDSLFGYTSLLFFYIVFIGLIIASFYTGSIVLPPLIGILMSIGHTTGHACNHWSMSSYNWINKFGSITCTCLWGLREKYWEFSHLISHHCYNYTDKDYIMEQHLPMKYFRFRIQDEWKPIHTYQHYMYILTPITAFIVGSLRFDCAPFIFIVPIIEIISKIISFVMNTEKSLTIKRNHDSYIPAPQFFASGSNISIDELDINEDGVGPENFVVYDTWYDTILSLIISNIIWLPLFICNYTKFGIVYAILFNGIAFGVQASIITINLLTQHLCEDIILQPNYNVNDDWYCKQIEGSTTVDDMYVKLWLTYSIQYQTEHHLFPSLNPLLLLKVQPLVQQTCKEYNVQYNYIPNSAAAIMSVYKHFQSLSYNPNKVK